MTIAGRRRDDVTTAALAATNVLAVRVPATSRNVAELRWLVASFAAVHGATDQQLANVKLGVTEAVTNAVVHGAARDEARLIDVVADVEGGALELVVTDDGPGLAAHVRSDGLGLGLGLMAKTSSRFTVHDGEPRGTQVWMRFELG